jgi:hypothetical protein
LPSLSQQRDPLKPSVELLQSSSRTVGQLPNCAISQRSALAARLECGCMRVAAAIVALACLTSLPAFAECVAPIALPDVPDGTTASRDSMLSAQKTFLQYDADMRGYATCLERNGASIAQYDAAVSQLHKNAAKFNAELRAFRKRGGA